MPIKNLKKWMGRLSKSFQRRIEPLLRILVHKIEVIKARPRWMKLKWERIDDALTERVEPAVVPFGTKVYIIGGYRTLDDVVCAMDVFDLKSGGWIDHLETPPYIAQTHCGVVQEANRFIYFVAGQIGGQCSPAVATCHVYDVQQKNWQPLLSLPEARYAPVACLWNQRLHILGGSKEDRITPACEHWSIAVTDGRMLEEQWREEIPVPIGGPHRSSAVVDDTLYLLGAQNYDRPAVAGDPCYKCDWSSRPDQMFNECYARKENENVWRRLADMPVAVSHVEYATFSINQKVFVLGGLMQGNISSNLIQMYDTQEDKWTIVGKLPWRNKGVAYGYYDGWLYVMFGQIPRGRFNAKHGEVLKKGYRTRFNVV